MLGSPVQWALKGKCACAVYYTVHVSLIMAHSYVMWGDRGEDDITKLPEEWEARVADDNRLYFVNHNGKSTQWEHPMNRLRYKVPPGLPYGWQKYKGDDNTMVYVDHIGQMSTSVDPRILTKVVFDFPKRYGIKPYTSVRNMFRPLVRAAHVLKGVDLQNKVAVVTGANCGLGYQTALRLAGQGAHVIMACRDSMKAEQAMSRIKRTIPEASLEFMHLNLASLKSVKAFTEEFMGKGLSLNILVCNAGVFGGPYSVTVDGLEQHFAINHLGHFYLAQLLLPILKRSKPSRVVVITSESHWHPAYMSSYLDLQLLRHPSEDKYSSITAYGTSKLCNLLFALQFHRNNVEQGVYCNAVHPGNLLPTSLTRDLGLMYKAAFTMARPFTKSVEQAASTVVYCAAHPSMEGIGGLYMYECWPAEPSPEAQDPNTAAALWELSEQIIREKIEFNNSPES